MKTNNQHQVNNQDQPKQVKRSSLLNEFFWICSGANRDILRQCPTEYSKYFGIGGTIFFTAAMAGLSGFYAFYTIFDSLWISICFGIFWSLLIFNLDRFIVNTMYSDGKHTISLKELGLGSPRIIIAIFLGVVISTPIEMRIFKDEIGEELNSMQIKETNKAKEENHKLYAQIKEKELKIEEFIQKQDENESELTALEERLYAETNGTGVTGKKGYGPAAKQLQEAVDRKRIAVKEANAKIDERIIDLKAELNKLNLEKDKSEANTNNATAQMTGFTARMEAMYNITSWKNKEQRLAGEKNTLFWVRTIIMLLFIIIK